MKQFTWVYLFNDDRTGYHKIGYSNNPYKRLQDLMREPTLLPEKPRFSLVEAWFARQECEKDLHRRFAERRMRGEWFELRVADLEAIEMYFYDRPRLSTDRSDADVEAEKRHWLTHTEAHRVDEIRSMANADDAGFLDFAVEGFGYEF